MNKYKNLQLPSITYSRHFHKSQYRTGSSLQFRQVLYFCAKLVKIFSKKIGNLKLTYLSTEFGFSPLIRAQLYSNFVKIFMQDFSKKKMCCALCSVYSTLTGTDSSKIREPSSFHEELPRRYMIRCFPEIAIHSRELRKHVYAVYSILYTLLRYKC